MLPQQIVVGRLFNEKARKVERKVDRGRRRKRRSQRVKCISNRSRKQRTYFFKYPRLGSFQLSQLGQILLVREDIRRQHRQDGSVQKTKEEYDKQLEERENKFRALYDERTASGADQKELQELEQNYQKEEQAFPKPKEEEFQFILREFVICFDTFGLDRQIIDQDRDYCKRYVQILRQNWQNKQKELLRKDIGDQLKLLIQNVQIPMQQALNRLIEQEDKELPSNEQVEKNKANQKLAELQMNNLRIEKIKEYASKEKELTYSQHLLERKVTKYAQIMKIFVIFAGFKKEQIKLQGEPM